MPADHGLTHAALAKVLQIDDNAGLRAFGHAEVLDIAFIFAESARFPPSAWNAAWIRLHGPTISALRMRVSISAIGSVIIMVIYTPPLTNLTSPRREFCLEGQFTEVDAAQPKAANIATRTATNLARIRVDGTGSGCARAPCTCACPSRATIDFLANSSSRPSFHGKACRAAGADGGLLRPSWPS